MNNLDIQLYKYGKDDLEGLRELFRNPDFRPDMLKIYPCLVMPGTPLYELWKRKTINGIPKCPIFIDTKQN